MAASYQPWDESPASEAQKSYYRELLIELANADLDERQHVILSEAINGLNKARRVLGIPFREFAA